MPLDDQLEATPDVLSLDNIANCAAMEMFAAAVQQVIANIADVNTSDKQKRSIKLVFNFTPFKDRSGAEVSVSSQVSLAQMNQMESSVYIARRKGELMAFPRNVRQQELAFGMDAADKSAQPGKPKAN